MILDRFLLKVLVQLRAVFLLQTIRVEPEQTFQSVTETFGSVLVGDLAELAVHSFVEVFTQEERPKPEQCVHLLRLARAHAFPFLQAATVILVVDLLSKTVLFQQRVRRMLERWQALRQ